MESITQQSVMKRIKIRSDDPNRADGKVLKYDESIDFGALMQKIVHKLKVVVPYKNKDIQEQFELRLGGNLLEETDEIEHDDDILLKRKPGDARDSDEASIQPPVAVISREDLAVIKSENDNKSMENEDNDIEDVVEDTTAQNLRQRRKTRVKKEVVELLSSDEDETEDEDEDDDGGGSVEQGSDAWESTSEENDSASYNFEEEENKDKKMPAKKKSKPIPEPPLQVIMESKDIPTAPGKPLEEEETPANGMEEVATLVDGAGRKKADRAVKDRIIKLLNTGFHDQSNENEAKNAMKLAQRLMQKHNLSQALLLKERQDKNYKDENGDAHNDEILKGGIVKVHIVNRRTGKSVLFARWLSQLLHPIQKNFDVKSYHSVRRGRNCTIVFYGIYTNAQLAAYAFRLATERISQMTAVYTPEKHKLFHRFSSGSTKSSRLSYAIGMVEGISKDVDNNIKVEKERRVRKLERVRLSVSTGEAYEESDKEDDDDGLYGDDDKEGAGFSFANAASKNDMAKPVAKVFTVEQDSNDSDNEEDSGDHDDDVRLSILPKPKEKSAVDADHRLQELEKEHEAAIVLVDHREKIAEQVLEDNGIKLRKGRKRKAIAFDHQSYRQGVEDAKEIDLNQRAIRDEVKIKKEEKKKMKP